MENINLTEDEGKALVGILYNHLSFATTLEVFGELSTEGVKRINLLRDILTKLLKKYGLSDKLTEETYLLLGMIDFVKKESLEKWAEDENNKHLQIRAKYFLTKNREV